jgi:hypothetical protein
MFRFRFAAVAVLVLTTLAVPCRAADLDPYLPADTESYVAINVRQILEAPIVKKSALEPLREMLKEATEVNDVLKDLGFDPFKDLESIIAAGPTAGEPDRGLIIVHGTFDVKKFQAKAANAAQNNADVLKIHKVPLGGGVNHEVYEVSIPGQGVAIYAAVASNKVLLASPGKDYVVDALKQVHQKKKPVLKNKDFQAVVEKLDPKQSLSLVVLGKSLKGLVREDVVPRAVKDAVADIEVIGGGLTVTKEIKLEVTVSSKSEINARKTRTLIDKGVKLAMVGLALLGDENKGINLTLDVMKTVKVSGKGKVVSVSAQLTADVLGDFFKNDQ